jgi:hypothetical protein
LARFASRSDRGMMVACRLVSVSAEQGAFE